MTKTKVQKAASVRSVKKVSGTEIGSEFISLSGKKFASKKEYLEIKLKREKSKFSLGFRIFESAINSGQKTTTINIRQAVDALIKKMNPKNESPKIDYFADSLITNRKRGFLGLIPGGENYRIENSLVKNLSKGDKSNGTINAIVKFDLVKS